jgi:hypothetical protein
MGSLVSLVTFLDYPEKELRIIPCKPGIKEFIRFSLK